MAVFFSVVSHGHASLIKELSCLDRLCEDFNVVVKSNTVGDSFDLLGEYSNFHWIDEEHNLGFGHNNNYIFNYCRTKLNMSDEDIFIILNPDVVIEPTCINELVTYLHRDDTQISCINLYRDFGKKEYDNSVRRFPTLREFVSSFLGLGNRSILDKSNINKSCHVDWAAGSFLAFKSAHYETLAGFDEKYFMYCEDIDICYRSSKLGTPLVYYPDIQAIHLAKHANRKLLSKHFGWHVSSVIRFLCSKHNLVTLKSSIKRK